jgi:hypothetical protein
VTVALIRRATLAALAAANLFWGVWAAGWPRGFFNTFPGFGHRWTGAYPPYNEHLVNDLGAIFITLAVLTAIAAWRDDAATTRIAMATLLVFNGLHLLFHATHRGELAGFDYAASLSTLVIGVIAPVAILVLTAQRR